MMFHLSLLAMLAFQAPPQDTASFRPSTPPDAQRAAQPSKPLSAEMRGDIFMARKMYREAADMYKQEPESAVIANKIGISYHQMQDLNQARKYYERAIKLDPTYSEAVNNLGTVYYAQKSYRRTINQYKK